MKKMIVYLLLFILIRSLTLANDKDVTVKIDHNQMTIFRPLMCPFVIRVYNINIAAFDIEKFKSSLTFKSMTDKKKNFNARYIITCIYKDTNCLTFAALMDYKDPVFGETITVDCKIENSKILFGKELQIKGNASFKIEKRELLSRTMNQIKGLISNRNYAYAESLLNTHFDFSKQYGYSCAGRVHDIINLQLYLVASRDGVKAAIKESERLEKIKWGISKDVWPEEILYSREIRNALIVELEHNGDQRISNEKWLTINQNVSNKVSKMIIELDKKKVNDTDEFF